MPPVYAKTRFIFAFCVLLYLFLCSSTIFASKKEDRSHYQNKLEGIQKDISKVQGHLKGSKKKRRHVLTELKTLESKIGINSRILNQLTKDAEKIKSQKRVFEKALKNIDSALDKQRDVLSRQMRSAYGMGQQQGIKLLLNQQDIGKIGRTHKYFDYLNNARQKQIDTFLITIQQKQQTETKFKQALLKQNKLLEKRREKKSLRERQRLERKELLTEISDKIKNQQSTLSDLQTSRNKLENVLESLGELLTNIPTENATNFKSLKGKLPWPVKGSFLGKFGQSKHHGGLKWKGVLIKAKSGTPVRVISSGQVAFSDWLQGFGFITIINHGGGFMSLYGHNETLLKQSGEWVQAGETIASAGDSGGQKQSGVYFEIRSHGKPVNPDSWCSSSVKQPTQ